MSKLPKEPSGIIVHEGKVCIVGNESNKAYFRFKSGRLPKMEGAIKLKALKAIDSVKVKHDGAEDLESIAVLENRIVVLSEMSRRIIGQGKTLVDASDLPSLREDKGGRGLEGMAILELPDNSNRIAVIWEGGVHKENENKNSKPAQLLMLQLAAGSIGAKVRLRREVWEKTLTKIKLDVSDNNLRFRCPDLVWCWSRKVKNWAFVFLLSTRDDKKKKYLRVYDVTGNPIGEPVHLKELGMPKKIVKENWEGLCWHIDDKGKDHLLLVNDTEKSSDIKVCRVRPPSNIRRSKK